MSSKERDGFTHHGIELLKDPVQTVRPLLFSVGVGGHALLPSPEEEAAEGEELRWNESAMNGQVGSPNAFPWPSIDCVVDSGVELQRLFESEATALVTEKLDGSNLCLHSNGVVASRRIVLANNFSLEDFKSLRYNILYCIRPHSVRNALKGGPVLLRNTATARQGQAEIAPNL